MATHTVSRTLDFDFLFYRDGDRQIAHCMQTDTAAFGDSVEEARQALRIALEVEIRAAIEDEGRLDGMFTPAPLKCLEQATETQRNTFAFEVHYRTQFFGRRARSVSNEVQVAVAGA